MSPSADRLSFNSISQKISEILERGDTAVLATVVNGNAHVGSKLLVDRTGALFGELGSADLNKAVQNFAVTFLKSGNETRVFAAREIDPALTGFPDTEILFERIEPERRVVVCGAGHVGAALAKLASLLGYKTTLIDDRAEFVQREKFPEEQIELVAANDWTTAVRFAVGDGIGVSIAVVTRGHSEDESCMEAIMETGADYVGMIGSKRRTRIVLDRLREKGIDAKRLATVHAPIGLDIGAVTPEEVALAVIAEIVAVRRGGKGGFLNPKARNHLIIL